MLKEISKKDPDLWQMVYFIKQIDESINLDVIDKKPIEVVVYLFMIRDFFRKAYHYREAIWWINFLLNMVYKPIMKFDRGRNQDGQFLYQSYASYVEEVYNFRVQMVQESQI